MAQQQQQILWPTKFNIGQKVYTLDGRQIVEFEIKRIDMSIRSLPEMMGGNMHVLIKYFGRYDAPQEAGIHEEYIFSSTDELVKNLLNSFEFDGIRVDEDFDE